MRYAFINIKIWTKYNKSNVTAPVSLFLKQFCEMEKLSAFDSLRRYLFDQHLHKLFQIEKTLYSQNKYYKM